MAIGWELAEWGRDFACPVAIANRGDALNDLLVASGVAGLIVGLLLAWRYLRRESASWVDREHQVVEFV